MRGFLTAYMILAVVFFFGMIGSSGPNGNLATRRRNCEKLVDHGRSIQAQITNKWAGGGRHSAPGVSYRYEVAGENRPGAAFPPPADWIPLRVGGPLEVLYLPEKPNVSEYRPDQWLADQASVAQIGRSISNGAVVLAVLVALFQIATIFSPQVAAWVTATAPRLPGFLVGLLFAAAGLGFQAMIVIQAMSPKGFVLTVQNGPPHRGSVTEIVLISLFLAIFWGIGLFIMVAATLGRQRRPSKRR